MNYIIKLILFNLLLGCLLYHNVVYGVFVIILMTLYWVTMNSSLNNKLVEGQSYGFLNNFVDLPSFSNKDDNPTQLTSVQYNSEDNNYSSMFSFFNGGGNYNPVRNVSFLEETNKLLDELIELMERTKGDCVGDFDKMSDCSASYCGYGTQTKKYKIKYPKGEDGIDCPHKDGYTVKQPCILKECSEGDMCKTDKDCISKYCDPVNNKCRHSGTCDKDHLLSCKTKSECLSLNNNKDINYSNRFKWDENKSKCSRQKQMLRQVDNSEMGKDGPDYPSKDTPTTTIAATATTPALITELAPAPSCGNLSSGNYLGESKRYGDDCGSKGCKYDANTMGSEVKWDPCMSIKSPGKNCHEYYYSLKGDVNQTEICGCTSTEYNNYDCNSVHNCTSHHRLKCDSESSTTPPPPSCGALPSKNYLGESKRWGGDCPSTGCAYDVNTMGTKEEWDPCFLKKSGSNGSKEENCDQYYYSLKGDLTKTFICGCSPSSNKNWDCNAKNNCTSNNRLKCDSESSPPSPGPDDYECLPRSDAPIKANVGEISGDRAPQTQFLGDGWDVSSWPPLCHTSTGDAIKYGGLCIGNCNEVPSARSGSYNQCQWCMRPTLKVPSPSP